MDYTSAKDRLEEHAARARASYGIVAQHSPQRTQLASNTMLLYKEKASEGLPSDLAAPAYQVAYFKNPILHFWEGDYFTISDHGWFAKTTHLKMNEYLPRGFSVYGATPKGLAMVDRRPLGYIRTPNGTYPYNMPAVFRYDGTPHGEGLTAEAHRAVSELGSYTNQYLDILLAHKEFDYVGKGRVDGDLSQVAHYSSCQMADAILQRKHYSHLAELAVLGYADVTWEGLTLGEIVQVLLADGSRAFRRSNTNEAVAERMEYIIKHRLPMPRITTTWLRQKLKPLINEFVIMTLGFDKVAWNRRERR